MPLPTPLRRLVGHGMAVGHDELTNLEFNVHGEYTYCRICGAIFQSELDRANVELRERIDASTKALTVEQLRELTALYQKSLAIAQEKRRNWSKQHAKSHTDLQHQMMQYSGRFCTPEAAYKLAAFGIIPLSDMVLDDEIEGAMYESKAVPTDDAEY